MVGHQPGLDLHEIMFFGTVRASPDTVVTRGGNMNPAQVRKRVTVFIFHCLARCSSRNTNEILVVVISKLKKKKKPIEIVIKWLYSLAKS